MKIILLRFEKTKINFIECIINNQNLTLGSKGNMSLESCENKGEKYQSILDELLQIKAKHNPDIFAYQSAQKYMGKIDEERFANEAILHLFCKQHSLTPLELSKKTVRRKTGITDKEFKLKIEKEHEEICKNFTIAKTNIMSEGVSFISIIKNLL